MHSEQFIVVDLLCGIFIYIYIYILMDYITMFADAYIYVQIVINIKNVGFVLAATFQGPLHGFYAPCPCAPSRCWHARRSIYIILFHRTCTLLNPTVPEKNHWNHGEILHLQNVPS